MNTTIVSPPFHTPGYQSLLVRLAKRGKVNFREQSHALMAGL